MKSKAYLFIFDGLADWEPAYALCEINKSGRFEVVTVGLSETAITTMGGLSITPQITLDRLDPSDVGLLILPGGDLWQEQTFESLKILLRQLHANQVLIGAICAATLEIARAGLTRNIRHTSNSKEYLKAMVPEYLDDDHYVSALAVRDNRVITASGLGSIEFAREVIIELSLYSETETQMWFEMFKHGRLPNQ